VVKAELVPREHVEQMILMIRGHKVLLDADLAIMYGVEVKVLNSELSRKLAALEKKYDAQFKVVFEAIRELMTHPTKPKRRIGFERE